MEHIETSPHGEYSERKGYCPLCGQENWNWNRYCNRHRADAEQAAYGWDHYDDPTMVGTAGDALAD